MLWSCLLAPFSLLDTTYFNQLMWQITTRFYDLLDLFRGMSQICAPSNITFIISICVVPMLFTSNDSHQSNARTLLMHWSKISYLHTLIGWWKNEIQSRKSLNNTALFHFFVFLFFLSSNMASRAFTTAVRSLARSTATRSIRPMSVLATRRVAVKSAVSFYNITLWIFLTDPLY